VQPLSQTPFAMVVRGAAFARNAGSASLYGGGSCCRSNYTAFLAEGASTFGATARACRPQLYEGHLLCLANPTPTSRRNVDMVATGTERR
jgi:hypothetical protein